VTASAANSPVSKLNLPRTCGQCHSNPALAAKYLFAVAKPVEAYESSVHGRPIQAGKMNAAVCNDCHGVHNILPSTDPRSIIAKANLPQTCEKCHPNAGKESALGLMHVLPTSAAESRWLHFVRRFYLFTIPTVVGFMLLHNFLDWLRKLRRHVARHRLLQTPLRFTLSERVQHALLLISFISLVITGFMLKFPESFWAAPLVRWEKGSPIRGLVHRVAGVVLIGAGFYHLLYPFFTA